MSIFNSIADTEGFYSIQDLLVGGRFNRGSGLTYTQALADSTYTCLGNWYYTQSVSHSIYVGNGLGFQLVNPNRVSRPQVWCYKVIYDNYTDIERSLAPTPKSLTYTAITKPFSLSSLNKVKELVSFNLACDSVGDLYPNVYVGTQRNFNDTINWVQVQRYKNPDGYSQYFLRDVGEYKYIRFKLQWSNTLTAYIRKIEAISLVIKPIKNKTR